MRPWAWQNVLDWWSLAHCWGWGLATYTMVRATARLRFGLGIDTGRPGELRWRIRFLDRPTVLLVIAVLAGIGWEAVEAAWIEPWLHFREPVWNRVTDIGFDALGAWMGCRTAVDRQRATLIG